MNGAKLVLIFYLINIALLIFLTILLKGPYFIFSNDSSIFLIPFFPIIPAFILGFIIMVVVNDNKKNKRIFTISHVICSVAFLLILTGIHFSNWNYNKKYGNIEANQEYLKSTEYMDMTDYKISFDTLITKFENPNDIRIIGSLGEFIDTTIEGHKHKIHWVRLIYNKRKSKDTYKADFTVSTSVAQMRYYDKVLNESDKKRMKATERKMHNVIKEAIKSVKEESKTRKQNN